MVKVVIDTNVFIGILLKSNNCLKIREAFLDDCIDIIISPEIISELITTLKKPKFKNIFSHKDIKELLTLIKQDIEIKKSVGNLHICRDTKDNHILECAIAGRADFIVTGDKDLLSLKSFRGILIVNPADFLHILKK